MEENNRKGPGIFYAVVGVATLVVAIIGATFAYFSASSAANTDIGGTTATGVSVSLAVTPVYPTEESGLRSTGKMVPLLEERIEDAIENKCVDVNGYVACKVYKVVVTNGSTTDTVRVNTTLQLTTLDTIANMQWQEMNDEYSDVTGTVVTDHTSATAISGDGANNYDTIAASGTATYYVMVWLNDNEDQTSTDAGKTFQGTVKANAVNADGTSTSEITATFAA